ncbi:MAG: zinc dependent phospholipase C family protein [Clostridiaceae bacterium]|nr:zinc dependent phospholipase C family protein [Clostridiaceae bacterium]
MEIKTHLYLAEKIYQNLTETLPVTFSLPCFKLANILPDYTHYTVVHPHFASYSLNYIKKQIDELMQKRFAAHEMPDRRFILRLGRITHYLCDFFCQVHADGKMGSPREHYRYEKAMDQAVVTKRAYFDQISKIPFLQRFMLPDQFQQLLVDGQKQYAARSGGFERDIWMAVRFSTTVACAILRTCLALDAKAAITAAAPVTCI